MWTLVIPLIFGEIHERDFSESARSEYRHEFATQRTCHAAREALRDALIPYQTPYVIPSEYETVDQPSGVGREWGYLDSEIIGYCVRSAPRRVE